MTDRHDSPDESDEVEVIELLPEPEHRNLRLDRYIAEQAPELSRSYVQTLIDSCRTQGAAAVVVVGFTPRAGVNLTSFNDINDR